MESTEIAIPDPTGMLPTITLVTFNLLFGSDTKKVDIQEVVEDLKATNADMIFTQGGSKFSHEVLFREFKQRGYQYTCFDQSNEVMFHKIKSSVKIKKKEYLSFARTSQRRGISKYLISVSDLVSDILVVTSQLEEGSGNGIRKSQITEIKNVFEGSTIPIIFIGDTNIPSWQGLECPEGWVDLWREKGTSENEHTTLHDRMDQCWYRKQPNIALACTYSLVCERYPRKGVMVVFTFI